VPALLKSPLDYPNVTELFAATANKYPRRPFLNVLSETAKIYGIDAGEISYRSTQDAARKKQAAYARAGYGPGHRIGILLENRPAFFIHWLALNALGVSIVPINPELQATELEYLVIHSAIVLAITIPARQNDLSQAGSENFRVIGAEDAIPCAPSPANEDQITQTSEAALLYTSGTTGLPKGCVLTNAYFLNCGQWYKDVGGHCALHEIIDNDEVRKSNTQRGERMITPLPLFHMNALACSSLGMMAVGGCISFLDRFHPRSWWKNVNEAQAGIIHYLGVMPAMLIAAPSGDQDKNHCVRFGFGAGVDRDLHAIFEARYGFPLVEAWAMSETGTGAVIVAAEEPRHVGTNCFGAPGPETEVRLIADDGSKVEPGMPGELLVRRAGSNPKFGFFDHYLKDSAATEKAWEGGWFHTGDIVCENEDGTFVFVDRKKNVIRRSGENIAAVEVENALLRHKNIAAIAVAATPDPVRGDEVFAVIVPKDTPAFNQDLAEDILAYSLSRLAYYKAPGYIAFVDALPLTPTNKIRRGDLSALVNTLRLQSSTFDMRGFKKRTQKGAQHG